LLFIVLDKLDTEVDRAISEHVLSLHQSRRKEGENQMYADMEGSDDEMDHDADDVWENSKNMTGAAAAVREKRGEGENFLKKDFCKKYIAYCKQKCSPTLTQEAVNMLAEKYAQLRDEEANGTLPITARCLETMIRLSSAHAKLRLSKKVEKKDVNEIIKILSYALKSSDTTVTEADDEMEVEPAEEEEEEVEPAEPRRRPKSQRIRDRQQQQIESPPSPQSQRRKRKEPQSNAQKKMITRMLGNYFRTTGETQVTTADFQAFLTSKNKRVDLEDLRKIILALDDEGKVFYVADKEMIHQM